MFNRMFRRWWLDRRIAHWQREVAHLEHVRELIGPQLDHAIRALGNARSDRVFLDIGRPPIVSAVGLGKRDGVDRFAGRRAEIREVELRG